MIRIEWFVVFILIVASREIYGIYSKKPTDYDSGYNNAISEVVKKWNEVCNHNNDEFVSEMRKYLQQKFDEK